MYFPYKIKNTNTISTVKKSNRKAVETDKINTPNKIKKIQFADNTTLVKKMA